MTDKKHEVAEKLFGASYEAMDEHVKKVARHITSRTHISRNTAHQQDDDITFGQRAADKVASFGGSWAFIFLFVAVLVSWVALNSYILVQYNKAFDPYPYILLNLFLSMLASIQAPIILMSQNRQAEKDRMTVEHDYEVNLKSELEIMLLHQKIDILRETQWAELLDIQKKQLELLSHLIKEQKAKAD